MSQLPSATPITEDQWITAFIEEWFAVSDGKADYEQLFLDGQEAFPVHGKTDPAEYARRHYKEAGERHLNWVRDPVNIFTALAAEKGLIKPGDKLDQRMLDYAYGIVGLCAKVGDGYGDPARATAGHHLRAVYGPLPF
ncbi:MAG: hypothetical protein V4645_29960 [Pseudomonadota bacterium]